MLKNLFTTLVLLCVGNLLMAQSSSISGVIIDGDAGEPLIGANVVIEGTGTGTSTDFDGKYQFKADPGTYNLVVSYIGYQDKKIEGVEFKEGENTFLDVTMSEGGGVELEEVVVQAKAIQRTENALLLLQRKSDKIQDGISAQEMSRYAAGDAAAALKKVTGTSIVDGKYVYVRGLGDRYSTTQVNGVQLPSSDPYRNSAQLDLIPTNLLENIVTSKTFTPDLPGSFTGGNVNIKIKAFPEQFTFKVSGSLGYNTLASNQSNFLSFNAGDRAGLGFNDGSLDRPTILDQADYQDVLSTGSAPSARRDDQVAGILDNAINSVNNQYEPVASKSGLNRSLSFSMGNQFNFGDKALGLLFTGSYSNSFQHIDNGLRSNYFFTGNTNATTLTNNFNLTERSSFENPTLGGLLGLSFKFSPRHILSANVIYNHNTEIGARQLMGTYQDFDIVDDQVFTSRSLSFTERQLINVLVSGEHSFDNLNNMKIDWTVSRARSTQDEPDLRFFASHFDPRRERYFISTANYDPPSHFFRDLTDDQMEGKVDITMPILQGKSKANKIKVGGSYYNKQRDFNEFIYSVLNQAGSGFTGDPTAYFGPDNSGVIGGESGRNTIGLYLKDNTRLENSYIGETNIWATYAMGTFQLSEKLKVIAGARLEGTDIAVESKNENLDSLRRFGNIEATDLLPSLNLVYNLTETMNLRAAYTNTLARPNMREIAPFTSFGFIGDPPTSGNPQLLRTRVNNFDLRYEWYPKPGELIAVSTFYKQFENPIVRTFRPASNPEFTWRNTGDANVIGAELELRKSLDFITPVLKNLKLGANLAVIKSEVDVDDVELAINREIDPNAPATREFQGQSPFVFNANLSYVDQESGIDAALSFNLFGDRLFTTGVEGTPDIYERSRGQMDLILSKKFHNRYTVKLSAQNILDPDYLTSSEFKGQEFVYSRYKRGRTFVVGFTYSLR